MTRGTSRTLAIASGLGAGLLCLAASAQTAVPPAGTTTRTATFVVSVIVDNDCLLSSATDLDFGHARAHAVGGAKPQVAPSLQVTHLTVSCSKNTRFTLSLDKGNVPDSTIDRRLAAAGDPANTDRLQYQLYLDPSYSTVWGDASGVAGNVSGIGTGVVQTFTVYGRILPQERPNADSYSSIITASLTF